MACKGSPYFHGPRHAPSNLVGSSGLKVKEERRFNELQRFLERLFVFPFEIMRERSSKGVIRGSILGVLWNRTDIEGSGGLSGRPNG